MDSTTTIRFQFLIPNRRKLLVTGLLVGIILLGAFLRFYNLGASGVGNAYYAAAVKSMLLSWENFFFVAFEPGGSISVDKPPLGFWVQAASAYFLGLNGFALAFPNALAGVFSIFLVYKLVKRPFGAWAGLAAALVLTLMPVAISTERNNTIDGLLVFVLLLAAWAFMESVYSGKIRWLMLGAFLVGLGFNIKMLQAVLPLPAFYVVYFFGAKHPWKDKILQLALATIVLVVVSFSWAVAVDLTPASERPYVDSTENNSALELIFGHNGIDRLTSLGRGIGLDNRPGGQTRPGDGNLPANPPNGMLPGEGQNFQPLQPPNNGNIPNDDGNRLPLGDGNAPGGQPGSMDFGTAGTLRLFTDPLAGEASWLLPFILGGMLLMAFLLVKQPFSDQHAAFILWVGWLVPEALYFTYSQGLMHAYYLIMMGAPIAALTAMTLWSLWKLIQQRGWIGWFAAGLLAVITIVFEAVTLLESTTFDTLGIVLAIILFSMGLVLAAVSRLKAWLIRLALTLILLAMLVAPGIWSVETSFNPSPNVALPAAGPSNPQGLPNFTVAKGDGGIDALSAFLLANTEPGTYLLAIERANEAANYILSTGRPVLALGGFLGQYNEVSLEQIKSLVESGQLRYVLNGGSQRYQEIYMWVGQNCRIAKDPVLNNLRLIPGSGDALTGRLIIYDCKK